MKKVLIFLTTFLVVSLSLNTFAQNSGNEDLISVKKSDLPADMVQKLEAQNKLQDIKQNLDTVKQMAGVGKEIGIALNDGLKAVTDQTVRFSQTPVGRFTMFLIAWKVMSKDVQNLAGALLGVIFGVPFLIFFDFFLLWIYRRTTNKRRVLIEEDAEKKIKRYEYQDTWYTLEKDKDGVDIAFMVCWWVVLAVGNVWIITGVIF